MRERLKVDGKDCKNLDRALSLEWLETNGRGGFASGTVAGANTRRYHALLLTARTPPTDRVVLVNHLEEWIEVNGQFIPLSTNVYPNAVHPTGYAYCAFKAIAAAGANFAARADKSGTSAKELSIWKKAAVDPAAEKPAWYLETGQGMGPTLTIASQKGAYTLTDRATYLANQDNLQLAILSEGDPGLLNVYHVMTVNPDKWPKVNYDGALAFMKFMTDPATQEAIGKFGVDKFGQQLFVPDAGKSEDQVGL